MSIRVGVVGVGAFARYFIPLFKVHPVDDFVRACATGKLPPNNVWDAARYVIPGVVAHESAQRGGELLEVPDLGPAPQGNASGRQ